MNELTQTKNCLLVATILIVLMAGLGLNPATAQEQDPFKVAAQSIQDENPFANHVDNDENPFGEADRFDEDPFAPDNPGEKNLGQADLDRLHAEITMLKRKSVQVERRNKSLTQKINHYEQINILSAKAFLSVIGQLLHSDEQALQLIALRELGKLEHKISLTEAIDDRLMQLTESDFPAVKKESLSWMLGNEPSKSVRLGYQRSGPWMAVSTNQRNADVQRALNATAHFDEEETELVEVVDQIIDNYGINVIVDSDVDAFTLVTFKASGLTLRTSLKMLLATLELKLHVHEEHLAIVPNGLPEPKLSLVYNVKGLLHDELSLVEVSRLIEDMIKEQNLDGKANLVDKYRLTITGSDSVHAKVSDFLAQLR